ncbi:prepilin peptidase [Gordonia insulae]|uniref:Prepilin type IV endopeptidase peptidase domain-containing protein n=1 Tax=Gordonia insulae TaxID=2420509 RepID=A0A3G8JGR8_9ACTN|nr:A24 family peptidase [Gordonia insulae]AZG44266.1 hypothetical protein D7316_00850 [Gordonia insulae]
MSECVVLIWLAVIAAVDSRTGRIPTPLVWPGAVAPLVVGVAEPSVALAAVVTACPYAIATLVRLCGGGDVKLAFAIGGLLADPGLGLLVVVFAAVVDVVGRGRREVSSSGGRPHARALVGAAVCGLALT